MPDNLLDLYHLIPQEVNDTSENIASMTAIWGAVRTPPVYGGGVNGKNIW